MAQHNALSDCFGVVLFCECMVHGEDDEGKIGKRIVGWSVGEYDVLDLEQTYVEISAHRAVCRLQPDLLLRRSPVEGA